LKPKERLIDHHVHGYSKCMIKGQLVLSWYLIRTSKTGNQRKLKPKERLMDHHVHGYSKCMIKGQLVLSWYLPTCILLLLSTLIAVTMN
jgi:hypothetical protein